MLVNSLNQTKSSFSHVFAHENDEVTAIYGGLNYSNVIYYAYDTINGVPPLSFKSNGEAIEDYIIEGNTIQNGTPTPEAPVDVVGCGVRTGNLFVSSPASGFSPGTGLTWAYDGSTLSLSGTVVGTGGRNTLKSSSFVLEAGQYAFTADTPIQLVIVDESTNTNIVSTSARTFTISDDCTVHVGVNVREADIGKTLDNKIGIMLNEGSTDLPYEPYGYKLPISCGGTTTNVYLGEQSATRRIKKLVLTGEESDWRTSGNTAARVFNHTIGLYDDLQPYAICNMFYWTNNAEVYNNSFDIVRAAGNGVIRFNNSGIALTVANWKSYLAAQYAAGTPVTVWYVLATPETAVVNEPLMKIGDYADTINYTQSGIAIPTINGTNTLAISTTVSPSNVEATGRIKRIIEGS